MVPNAEAVGAHLTRGGDHCFTRVGNFLRKFKLDELPQFFNVLRGDMSLVGPRPKLAKYAEMLDMPYRPGITGAATLEFRNEEEKLRRFSDPGEMEMFYRNSIMPEKARLDRRYMQECTFYSDIHMIMATFLSCLRVPHPESGAAPQQELQQEAAGRLPAEMLEISMSN
jgi:lipopolysaccharide/colanic/teichoic acid biosynthesis glycosyltransferase